MIFVLGLFVGACSVLAVLIAVFGRAVVGSMDNYSNERDYE